MYPVDDRLTLAALLSDPLTQLVMRSDNLTQADVARAFDEARRGLFPLGSIPYAQASAPRCTGAELNIRWNGV